MGPLELNGWIWLAWSSLWFLAALTAAPAKTREGFAARLTHTLPTVLGLALIFGSRRWLLGLPARGRYAGDVLTLAGLLFAVWARVHLGKYWSGILTLKEDHRLVRTGPFALARHPIYTGLLGASFGSALAAATVDALFGVAILIATYIFKARREERLLTREFGEAYRTYMKQTPALIPRLPRVSK